MPVVRLDPQYDNIRVRRYWALRVPISRPNPLTIFTVIATDTTDEPPSRAHPQLRRWRRRAPTPASPAAADVRPRPSWTRRVDAPYPVAGGVAVASPRPPVSPAAHPGPHAATSASRGHICRDGVSAPPSQHAEEGRRGRWRRWPRRSHPSLWSGWWSPPPCMSCRKKMRRGETETRKNQATRPCGRIHFRRRPK